MKKLELKNIIKEQQRTISDNETTIVFQANVIGDLKKSTESKKESVAVNNLNKALMKVVDQQIKITAYQEMITQILNIEHTRGGSLGSDGQFYYKVPESIFKKLLTMLHQDDIKKEWARTSPVININESCTPLNKADDPLKSAGKQFLSLGLQDNVMKKGLIEFGNIIRKEHREHRSHQNQIKHLILSKDNLIEKQLAELVKLNSQKEWTSVKDHLPQRRTEILVSNSDGKTFKCMYQGGGMFKVDCTVWECSNVTHWQPLPERKVSQE